MVGILNQGLFLASKVPRSQRLPLIEAAVSPPPSPSTREARQRIPSGSRSFRERLPQMADSRRFGGVAVATQETASAVRVVDV